MLIFLWFYCYCKAQMDNKHISKIGLVGWVYMVGWLVGWKRKLLYM
ncbi:hypothetical protein HanIR_Chr13g0670221 [Helianthus annuus]|nr:hypothetical protein HanIR_Chr13g0670221 [Helianthus annuus]